MHLCRAFIHDIERMNYYEKRTKDNLLQICLVGMRLIVHHGQSGGSELTGSATYSANSLTKSLRVYE